MFLNLDQCVNCEGVEQGLASFPTHIEQHIIICYIHFDILTEKKHFDLTNFLFIRKNGTGKSILSLSESSIENYPKICSLHLKLEKVFYFPSLRGENRIIDN